VCHAHKMYLCSAINYQLFKNKQSSKKTKQKRFLQRIDHSATVTGVADIYGAFVSNVLNYA